MGIFFYVSILNMLFFLFFCRLFSFCYCFLNCICIFVYNSFFCKFICQITILVEFNVIFKIQFIFHLNICVEFYITVLLHTCSGRNMFTDDNVLFQTNQMVNFTLDSCFCQNLCCLLEGSG